MFRICSKRSLTNKLEKILKNSTKIFDSCPPIQNVELASPDSGEVRADVDQIILHPDYVVRKRNFMFFCPDTNNANVNFSLQLLTTTLL